MRKWILRAAGVLAFLFIASLTAGWILARRFEPFVREQAIGYLEQKFGTGVQLASSHVSVTLVSPFRWRSAGLRVRGEGLVLPDRGGTDRPPLVKVGNFDVRTDLGAIWESPRRVHEIRLRAVEINIPPREKPAPSSAGAGHTVVSVPVMVGAM